MFSNIANIGSSVKLLTDDADGIIFCDELLQKN